MDNPRTPARRPDRQTRIAQVIATLLTFFGILELLRTGVARIDDPVGMGMFGYSAHFMAGAVHVLVGMVGLWCAAHPRMRAPFLTGAAVLFAAWVVAAFILDGRPNDAFAAGTVPMVAYLVIAASAVYGLVRGNGSRAPASPSAIAGE